MFGEASPRTPDRIRPAVPLDAPEDVHVREVVVGPTASPLHVHSCGTPSRQLPMKSPALTTGCSRTTPARGIATPVRSTRRRDCAVSQKEHSAPTPRALSLWDEKVISLSDLASPGPSSPCQCSPEFNDTACGFEDMELVQEIPISDSLLSFDQVLSMCGHQLRNRQPEIWMPVPEIPTSTSYRGAASSDSMSKASDPRMPRQPMSSADAPCRAMQIVSESLTCQGCFHQHAVIAHDPRKRRRRYRSPTPVTDKATVGAC